MADISGQITRSADAPETPRPHPPPLPYLPSTTPRYHYAAQGPVPLGRSGPESASLTMLSGTASPPGGPLSLAAAKTVARTFPEASTTGPPALQLLTLPRNEVFRTWIGLLPYDVWIHTDTVCTL